MAEWTPSIVRHGSLARALGPSLAETLAEVEAEVNPFLVGPEGAVAVDALARVT